VKKSYFENSANLEYLDFEIISGSCARDDEKKIMTKR